MTDNLALYQTDVVACPTISIAMTTFNGARFLASQLQSLLAQTLPPFELVIIDDCSTDDTVSILREFARQAPFSVLIFENEKNIGYKANFMACIELCSGDLIAFCDQDDVWKPTKLAHVVQTFEAGTCWLIHHTFSVIDDAGRQLPISAGADTCAPWSQIYGFSVVLDRRLLAFNALWKRSKDHFDARQPMAHDQWFSYLADLMGAGRPLELDLVAYRQHSSNTCGVDAPRTSGEGLLGTLNIVVRYGLGLDRTIYEQKRQILGDLFRDKACSVLSRLTIAKNIALLDKNFAVRQDRITLYTNVYEIFYLRSHLYGRLSRQAKLMLFFRIMRRGYADMGRKVGLKSIILDLGYGVFARPQ